MSDYEEQCNKIHTIIKEHMDQLSQIWKTVYVEDECKKKIQDVVDCAKDFFEDLVKESEERLTVIKDRIIATKYEAETLKSLLNVDVDLPQYENGIKPWLVIQSEMDKCLLDLQVQLSVRKKQICQLLLEQEPLCQQLGEPPRDLLAHPLANADEIEDFRNHLDNLRQKRDDRMATIPNMCREIVDFFCILNLEMNTETQTLLASDLDIKIHKEIFEKLKRLHSDYGVKVTEIGHTIKCSLKQLKGLWETSDNTRFQFSCFNANNQTHFNVIYNEHSETQNIKLNVQQIREEIRGLWDKTFKSEVQRNRFSNFTSTCFTDDLLVLHKTELENLKLYYETNKLIFDLYANRNTLWERMAALEAKARGPGRYNNQEQKEHKTLASQLPEIERQIRDLVQEYEDRERTPFLVYGKSIVDAMAEQWEEKQKDKELVQSAHKNAATETPGAAAKPVNSTSLRKTRSASSLNVQEHAATSSSLNNKLIVNDRQTAVAKRHRSVRNRPI